MDIRPARLPLARYSLVDTHDPAAAQVEVGRIFCAHRLTPMQRGAPNFHAIHNNAGHDGFSVNYVAYGADVEIDPGCLDRFFLLQVPLNGAAAVRCGTEMVEASATRASLLSPTLPTLMRWREGTEKLIVLIERGLVQNHLSCLLDRSIDRIEFSPAVALDAPTGAALRAQVLLIQALSERAATMRGGWPMARRADRPAARRPAAQSFRAFFAPRRPADSGPRAARGGLYRGPCAGRFFGVRSRRGRGRQPAYLADRFSAVSPEDAERSPFGRPARPLAPDTDRPEPEGQHRRPRRRRGSAACRPRGGGLSPPLWREPVRDPPPGLDR